jgi:hypothetical protein
VRRCTVYHTERAAVVSNLFILINVVRSTLNAYVYGVSIMFGWLLCVRTCIGGTYGVSIFGWWLWRANPGTLETTVWSLSLLCC